MKEILTKHGFIDNIQLGWYCLDGSGSNKTDWYIKMEVIKMKKIKIAWEEFLEGKRKVNI